MFDIRLLYRGSAIKIALVLMILFVSLVVGVQIARADTGPPRPCPVGLFEGGYNPKFGGYNCQDAAGYVYDLSGTPKLDKSGNRLKSDTSPAIKTPTTLVSFAFLIAVVLTIAIEIFIFWLFKLRGKKQYLLLGLLNIVTLAGLWLLLGFWAVIGLGSSVLVGFSLGEVLVWLIEAVIVKTLIFKSISWGKSFLVSAVANLASAVVGTTILAGLALLVSGFILS